MRGLIDARVLADPNPGGVTRVARALIEEMIKQNPSDAFTLVTSGLKKSSITTPQSAAHHIRVPNKLIALATYTGLTSLDRLTGKKFDVLFLPNLEMVGVPKIPYALLIHDLSFFIEPAWFNLKGRLWHIGIRSKRLIENASALFTVSDHTKQDLISHFKVDASRIQTLPLGHTALPQDSTSLPPELIDKPYFLILGGNDPRKNIACVTSAFEELKKDPAFTNVKLVIIGTPKGRPSVTNPDTLFIPRPSDALLSTLMRNTRALLYPSWYEGFGLPLHEAHTYGVPLIASTSGALPETAPAGTIFSPPFKPHLWMQAMKNTLTKPSETPAPPLADWSEASKIVAETLKRLANG